MLVSTHDLASISTFCDRVILLNQTILAAGTTAEAFTAESLAMTFGGLPISALPRRSSDQDQPMFTQPVKPEALPTKAQPTRGMDGGAWMHD